VAQETATTNFPTTITPTPLPLTTPAGPKPTVVPKTPVGVSVEEINKRLNSDPAIAGLLKQVTKVLDEATQVEKIFEIDMSVRNITLLNQILQQCKLVRQSQTSLIMVGIQSEIASAQPRTFFNRLLLEALRIQTVSYDKIFKWIGLEILGDLSDVSKFENYYYSEAVAIARQLIQARYYDILVSAIQIDQILEDVQKTDPLHTHVDAATKQSIDKHLKDILAATAVVKKEISADYYTEVERIRLENRELNLMQRMDIEMNIDMLNNAANFITKYEELFLRINTF